MRTSALLAVLLLAGCPGPLTPVDTDPGTTTDPGTDSGTQPVGHGDLSSIGLTPFDPSIDVSGHLQFRVDGIYADGFTERLYDGITWSSSDVRVAQVDSSGVAIAAAPGAAVITATHSSGLTASVNLTVLGDTVTLSSVLVAPATASLWPGDTAQFSATASYSDGTTGNIGGSCGWASSNSGVATVDAAGLVTAVAVGSADISATCAPLSAVKGTVTVQEPTIDLPSPDLTVLNPATSVLPNGDVHYTATIKNIGTGYSRGFDVDVFLDSAAAPTATAPRSIGTWIPGLGAGETNPIVLDVTKPAPGDYKSWIVLDRPNDVDELVETNNSAGPLAVHIAAPVGAPNLVFTSYEGFGDDAWGTLYSVTIKNEGTVDAAGFYLDLYYDPSFTPEAPVVDWMLNGDDFIKVPSLAAGASYTWDPETAWGPSATDAWNSCFLVDSMGDVDESNESDNLACFDVAPW